MTEEKKELVIKHEPYSVDEFNYNVLQHLGNPERLYKLPSNRFTGKRVRQNSKKLKQIKARDRILRKHGMTIMMFGS
jgi:chromosome condensin MukBEF MukE localization factor